MKLTPQKSAKVSCPGIAESPVNIECRVTEEKKLGTATSDTSSETGPDFASAQAVKLAMIGVARKMKEEGLDIDTIAKFTNLTKAEVRKA